MSREDKQERFLKRMSEVFGNKYTVMGKFKSVSDIVKVRHNECGYEWDVRPQNLFSGKSNCPKCSGKAPITDAEFKETVVNITNHEYEAVGGYENNYTKVTILHKVCGYEWGVEPRNFVNKGRRCPRCKTSKGEEVIARFLENKNIKFKVRHSFDDCRGDGILWFDFAVFDEEEKLKCIIEYDGEQHYNPELARGRFEINTRNDRIKDDYCKKHGIPLLRIPYWEFSNIEKILNKFISI